MNIKKKALTLLTVCLLLFSAFAIINRNYTTTAQPNGTELTGKTDDSGKDTDGNGKYDYLEVAVEINVSVAGNYRIEACELVDQYKNRLYLFTYTESYIDRGTQLLNLSFYGPTIYAAHFNPKNISELRLYECNGYKHEFLGSIQDVPLFNIYNCTDFDCAAVLTGTVYEKEIDPDKDGLLDALQIGVEINVTEDAIYEVTVEDLSGNYTHVPVHNSSTAFLTAGNQTINVSVYGPKIFSYLHDSQGNVSYVSFSLSVQEDYQFYFIDERWDVPLNRTYYYYTFESHAFFTGNIFDSGVDEDDDGLFDYLEVGVEVNVTEAGSYRISADGLREENDVTENIYYYHYFDVDLDKKVHIINFTFPGPMIAYHRLNPTNITGLRLAEYLDYYELGYINMAALPTKYNYTQFNSPFKDMEIEFVVYPDATVGLNGNSSHTHIYPPQCGPLFNATIGFSTSGDTTIGSVDGTMMPPEDERNNWPLNSTTAEFLADYYNDMLNAQLNATVFMPPEGSTTYPFNSSDFSFFGTYSNEMLDLDLYGETELSSYYASQLPFNVTDVTVLADYVDNRIDGNITFHTVSGFPLGDVIVYFSGNKTEISFNGYINVIYGNYSDMWEINATTLEGMLDEFNSTIPGRGDESFYNMTDGAVECTVLNTTKTPLDSYGARIDYNATLCGNFTDFLAKIVTEMFFMGSEDEAYPMVCAALNATFSSVQTASLELNYYYLSKITVINLSLNSDVKELWSDALQLVPPTVPEEYKTQCEAWLKIANATAYAIKNVSIDMDYSSAEQKLNLKASLTANMTELKNATLPILSDAVPLELREIFESYINTTYCKLNTFNIMSNYTYGTAEFEADWTLKGDFKAQTNHGKRFIINFLNATNPGMNEWQMRFFNATEIDINNFKADIRQGEDWMTFTFEGLKAFPVKDERDFIRFKLYNWLNMASDPEAPPKEFEKLKIAITGGFNGTHIVLLHAPGTLPSPNVTSLDYKTMTWENVTMSGLKDLLFKIAYQGVIDHLGKTYYVPIFTNSTASHFDFNSGVKCISFNVTGATGTEFCNVTIPRALLYATPEWDVRIDGEPVEFNVTENGEYVFIYLNYTHSNHLIEIKGTWIITEFPPNMLPLILMIISLIAVIIVVKQRKKLDTLKTKYQSVIRTFANRLHELKT